MFLEESERELIRNMKSKGVYSLLKLQGEIIFLLTIKHKARLCNSGDGTVQQPS